MSIFVLTENNLSAVKGALGEVLPEVKSSHRCEALAAAIGFNTHAAALAALKAAPVVNIAAIDQDAFDARLKQLGGYDSQYDLRAVIGPLLTKAGTMSVRQALDAFLDSLKSTMSAKSFAHHEGIVGYIEHAADCYLQTFGTVAYDDLTEEEQRNRHAEALLARNPATQLEEIVDNFLDHYVPHKLFPTPTEMKRISATCNKLTKWMVANGLMTADGAEIVREGVASSTKIHDLVKRVNDWCASMGYGLDWTMGGNGGLIDRFEPSIDDAGNIWLRADMGGGEYIGPFDLPRDVAEEFATQWCVLATIVPAQGKAKPKLAYVTSFN